MRRFTSFFVAILLSLAGLAGGARAQSTGLVFLDPGTYNGIPIAELPYSGDALPASIDLSAAMPPPSDQGNQQSCVGWAVAYALKTYDEQQKRGWSITGSGGAPLAARTFSPAFIYNQINNGNDNGSFITHALSLVAQKGVASLATAPYSPMDYHSQPSPVAQAEAAAYKILTWRRVNATNPVEVKSLLAAKFPIVIGALVDQSFKNLPAGSVWTASGGGPGGGHAMVVVGYDDAKMAFKVMNSWGPSWSENGFGWIGYGQFAAVVREAYQVVGTKQAPSETGPGPMPSTPSPGPTPVILNPTPPSVPAQGSSIRVTNVIHNIQLSPGVVGMRIDGQVSVPSGIQGMMQVVVTFTTSGGNRPVPAIVPTFATPLGQAATGTPPVTLTGAGINNLAWYAVIPYCALGVPKGQMCLPYPVSAPLRSDLMGHTTLFIDNFGAASGPSIPFFVVL
jgi:hypothetical protein